MTGCPNFADDGELYCSAHKKAADYEYNHYRRDPETKKRYGRAWKRIRDRHIREHPLCDGCLKEGRLTPVQKVHRILPVSKGGTHAKDNLMSPCQSCHTKVHHDLGDR
jgi:5-methylcytosine-specific restriction protein A